MWQKCKECKFPQKLSVRIPEATRSFNRKGEWLHLIVDECHSQMKQMISHCQSIPGKHCFENADLFQLLIQDFTSLPNLTEEDTQLTFGNISDSSRGSKF